MKSQKGITLMSLMIYVVAFLAVIGIIAAVTSFFYANYSFLDDKSAAASEYTKLNLVLSNESKVKDNSIYAVNSNINAPRVDNFAEPDEELNYETKYELLTDLKTRCENYFDTYVLFFDESFIGWKKDDKVIYYNQNIICENVENLILTKEVLNSNNVLKIYVKLGTKAFNTKYIF